MKLSGIAGTLMNGTRKDYPPPDGDAMAPSLGLRDGGMMGFLAIVVLWRFRAGASLKYIYSLGDVGSEFLPFRFAAAQALRQHHFLLWSPQIFCGYPAYANPQAAIFYPVGWLLSFLVPPWGFANAFTIFHFGTAAIFMYLFLRDCSISPLAAFVGAIAFSLNGNRIYENFVFIGPVAWLPLLFLLVRRWVVMGKRRYLWGACLVGGLQWLAGNPQMAFTSSLGVLAFAIGSAHTRGAADGKKKLESLLAGAILLCVFPLCIAAVQAFPTYELTRFTSRAAPDFAFISAGSMEVRQIPKIVTGHFIEYLGVVPVVMTLVAIVFVRSNRVVRLFAVLACVFLLVCLGSNTPLFALLFDMVPGVNKFRIPFRYFVLVTFFASALAAFGVDRFVGSRSNWAKRNRWIAAEIGVAITALLLWDYWRIDLYHYDPKKSASSTVFNSAPASIQFLERQVETGRVFSAPEDLTIWSPFEEKRSFFEGDSPLMSSVGSLGGYVPLQFNPYMNVLGRVGAVEGDARLRVLGLLGGRFLVTDRDDPAGFHPEVLSKAGQFGSLRIFVNPAVVPRVVVSQAVRVVPDDRVALQDLESGKWNPASTILLSKALPSFPSATKEGNGRVLRVVEESDHVRIEASTDAAAVLCLSDTNYPGWKATVNGNPVSIFTANLIFRGVVIPPGRSVIEFSYRPKLLFVGALISVLSVLFALVSGRTDRRAS